MYLQQKVFILNKFNIWEIKNMCIRKILTLALLSFSFAIYQVGDQISQNDQDRVFEVCYGAEHHGIEPVGGRYNLTLGDYNGFTNDTGIFYVLMIDMAASW
ncbi:MAG: hypothetical protein CBD26_03395 [Candidatus Pelagibacter sp. TMED166]|nr:MAG: hypothetical protein CBD26_03395 [Candidatus Pelagibacter sp. TMED166]